METRANRCIGRHWSCFWTFSLIRIFYFFFFFHHLFFTATSVTPTLCLSFITPINLLCGLPLFLPLGSSKFNILCPVQPLPKPFQPRLSNFPKKLNPSFHCDIVICNPVPKLWSLKISASSVCHLQLQLVSFYQHNWSPNRISKQFLKQFSLILILFSPKYGKCIYNALIFMRFVVSK